MTIMQLAASGLLQGGVYALIAMGLTLIFGVMRLVNFAQGEFITLGMYGAFLFFGPLHLNPYISLLVVVPAAFLVGCVLEMTIFRRISKSSHAMQMLVTFGISLILQNAMLLLFSGDYRSVNFGFAQSTLSLGGIHVNVGQLIAFAASLAIGAALLVYLKYTRIGRALRAIQQNRYAIRLMGVNIDRLFTITFGIGISLAAVAGVLLAPSYFVSPTTGGGLVFTGFVVVVLGGLGSMPGAILGGLIIGLVESLSGYFLPSQLKDSISLAVFVIVLLVKPAGLLGQRGAEEVGFK